MTRRNNQKRGKSGNAKQAPRKKFECILKYEASKPASKNAKFKVKDNNDTEVTEYVPI